MAKDQSELPDDPSSGLSRRDFLKLGGVTLSVPLVAGARVVQVGGKPVEIHGPDKASITLTVNGKQLTAELEPRVTLLDALRDHLNLTGAKRVCDRGECGACTVLMDGRSVYACSVLAIDAQGRQITTIESLGTADNLHPIQKAFVENDAQQCGFCTPGFVMASKALLDKNPHPSPEDALQGLGGNYCRCGTYRGLRAAVLVAAGQPVPSQWTTLARGNGSRKSGTPEAVGLLANGQRPTHGKPGQAANDRQGGQDV
jgi:xanthine dehydrogenase YagT iron-sulfur-binding subunit